jgi:hypothetical protein
VFEKVVDSWLDKKSPKAVAAPPLSSFKELHPTQGPPATFVCEEDVRSAIQSKSQIVLGRKTIVTPSARDLGEANDVFVTEV